MARGRMIDKRVSNSKKLGKISDKAARLYFMIYPHLDKKGRIAFDDLGDLKTEIIPLLKGWSFKKIGISLNELSDVGLIQTYPNREKIAMQFERFGDFQTIREDREAASKIVAPGETPESSGVFRITPALSLSLMKLKEGMKEGINTNYINFNFQTRKWLNIKIEDRSGWLAAYPACDIELELHKMREWLLANPEKKKKNYRRFIVNWLIRTQDKGGSQKFKRAPGGRPMTRKEAREQGIKDWVKKPIKEGK